MLRVGGRPPEHRGPAGSQAFVPDTGDEPIDKVAVRNLAVDRVVLAVSRSTPALRSPRASTSR